MWAAKSWIIAGFEEHSFVGQVHHWLRPQTRQRVYYSSHFLHTMHHSTVMARLLGKGGMRGFRSAVCTCPV